MIFFEKLKKMKKNDFLVKKIFWVSFREKRPIEDDLAKNFTSLDFPDACVTSI